jgi:hypothetical protein
MYIFWYARILLAYVCILHCKKYVQILYSKMYEVILYSKRMYKYSILKSMYDALFEKVYTGTP